jgi:hypothetical protein
MYTCPLTALSIFFFMLKGCNTSTKEYTDEGEGKAEAEAEGEGWVRMRVRGRKKKKGCLVGGVWC